MSDGPKPNQRMNLTLALAAAATLVWAGCGGGGSGADNQAKGSPEESLTKIADRAKDAGYDVSECSQRAIARFGSKCVGPVVVGKNGDTASLSFLLYGTGTPSSLKAVGGGGEQKYGVYRPSFDYLTVNANTTPGGPRAELKPKVDSAREREALKERSAAWAIIGDHLWSAPANGPGSPPAPVIDEQKFLDLIGNLEGCAPDCNFEETSFGD